MILAVSEMKINPPERELASRFSSTRDSPRKNALRRRKKLATYRPFDAFAPNVETPST
ncbi:MAG: hypothetical protein ACI4NV_00035 [Thermoguttaceae bacterium]